MPEPRAEPFLDQRVVPGPGRIPPLVREEVQEQGADEEHRHRDPDQGEEHRSSVEAGTGAVSAERIPMGIPTSSQMMAAPTASWTVTHARSIDHRLERCTQDERLPEPGHPHSSPRKRFLVNVKNWTYAGLSSPNVRSDLARSSRVWAPSRRSGSRGQPAGSRKKMEYVTATITIRTKSTQISRRITYRSTRSTLSDRGGGPPMAAPRRSAQPVTPRRSAVADRWSRRCARTR